MMTPNAADAAFSKLSHIALARSKVFELLAIAFFDPTPELVQQVGCGVFVSELHDYFRDLITQQVNSVSAEEQLKVLEPLHAVQRVFSEGDPVDVLKALKVEYARLFIGPGGAVLPPYETFHACPKRDSKPLLMVSPEAIAVENAYRRAGVAVSSELHEPPDHFATELEFLYYLCSHESDCWAEGQNDAARKWRRHALGFLEKHLGHWGVEFCRKVEDISTQAFYRAVAHFAVVFIEMEANNPGAG